MQRTPRIILVIFCLFLIAPAVGHWFNFDFFPRHNENRTLAERPIFSLSFAAMQKFPREYQAYFNENFDFRNTLIRGNFLLRYGLLGVSPSNQVVCGSEGWLYYTGDGESDDSRGITRFNDEQLRRWAMVLTIKKDRLAQIGIRYLLVIPPNKSTIYPEYLPAGYGRVREETQLDDLMTYIRQHTDVEVVDLRAPLLERKRERNLYLRTDTHWNRYGAFLAYQEMMRPIAKWFPTIKPFELDDFDITLKKHFNCDLAGMMGGQEFLTDEDYVFSPKKPLTALMREENKTLRGPFTMSKDVPELPRAVIFRDSFFDKLVPFVAEHFSVSHYVWTRWTNWGQMDYLISRYQPNIVIEEVVERLIKHELNRPRIDENF